MNHGSPKDFPKIQNPRKLNSCSAGNMNPVLLNLFKFNSKKLRSTTWKICRLGLPLTKTCLEKVATSQACCTASEHCSLRAPPAASASALITKLTRHAQPGFLLHAAGTPDTGDKIEPEVQGGKKCVVPRKNRFPKIPHAI